MKIKLTSALVFSLLTTTPALAWDYGNDAYNRSGENNYKYQGSGGTQYQYDLSRPSDQIRYQTDVGAQMRDQLSVDPRRDLDQSLGQYGGGIRR